MLNPVILASSLALVLLLGGCGDPTPVPPRPSSSSSPAFASDEEALAAAEEAYAAYLAVSDAIAADGGLNPERLEHFVTSAQFTTVARDFGDLQASGRHMEGASRVDTQTLQKYDDSEVRIYLCLDVSGVRVLDSSGADVTPADRPDRVPLEVGFVVERSALLLDTSDVWEEAGYCE